MNVGINRNPGPERQQRASLTKAGRPFSSGPTGASHSSAAEERALRGDDVRPDIVDAALTKQTRRRAVVELGVQPLEPRPRDLGPVDLCDRPGNLECKPESALHRVTWLADTVSPLVNGASLLHRAEIRAESQPENLAQGGHDLGKAGAHSPNVCGVVGASDRTDCHGNLLGLHTRCHSMHHMPITFQIT